jgi:hypothetical protein
MSCLTTHLISRAQNFHPGTTGLAVAASSESLGHECAVSSALPLSQPATLFPCTFQSPANQASGRAEFDKVVPALVENSIRIDKDLALSSRVFLKV